jgi:hypothetical protein
VDKMQTIQWLVRLMNPNQDLELLFREMMA